MAAGFFIDPQFLGLLRFWEEQRGEAPLPEWERGLAEKFPPELAPHLVAARHDRSGDGVYLHVGEACVRRFGLDPTGRRVGETLAGPIRDYIFDVARTMRREAAPVFSASIYHIGGEEPIRTGRLLAPFSPDVVLSVLLFEESSRPLLHYNREGSFEEVERRRIAHLPDGLRRLEEAARYHRLGRSLHVPGLASELQALARAFDIGATEPLPVFGTVEGSM